MKVLGATRTLAALALLAPGELRTTLTLPRGRRHDLTDGHPDLNPPCVELDIDHVTSFDEKTETQP